MLLPNAITKMAVLVQLTSTATWSKHVRSGPSFMASSITSSRGIAICSFNQVLTSSAKRPSDSAHKHLSDQILCQLHKRHLRQNSFLMFPGNSLQSAKQRQVRNFPACFCSTSCWWVISSSSCLQAQGFLHVSGFACSKHF